MKKFTCVLIFCFFLASISLSVSAVPNYVVDMAGLLDDSEIRILEETCSDLASQTGMDLVFLTTNTLNSHSAMDYADIFYENGSYGADGILFLVDMGSRQYHISTSGWVISALSDYELYELEDIVVPYLSDGLFFDGFYQFQNNLPRYLDSESHSESEFSLLLSLLIGSAIACIAVLIMRFSMNSKRAQRNASNYEVNGSYHLNQHQDLFLYSNVSKRRKPKNDDSVSSSHRSSSGGRHGGHGGSF